MCSFDIMFSMKMSNLIMSLLLLISNLFLSGQWLRSDRSSLSTQILLLFFKKNTFLSNSDTSVMIQIFNNVQISVLVMSPLKTCHLCQSSKNNKFLCLTSLSTLLPHPCSVRKASAVIQSLCPIFQYDKSITMQHRVLINICQSLFGNLPTLTYRKHSLPFFI